MSSLTSLFLDTSTSQLANLLGIGASTGSTQTTSSANDSFAALFAQTLAAQAPAQTTTSAQSTTSATSASSGHSSLSADMTSLSQALSSGNLAAAQQAFQAMQTDLQGSTTGTEQAHRHHHHHHQDQDAAGSAGTTAQAATGASAQSDTSSSLLAALMGSSQTA